MIENKFAATNLPDALEYIRMHLETGYTVSVKKTKSKIKATKDWRLFQDDEYLIVAIKED